MLQIDITNRVSIDGEPTGLSVTQRPDRTVVYTFGNTARPHEYREYQMPHQRYATSHDAPASGVPGRAALESDIIALLARI